MAPAKRSKLDVGAAVETDAALPPPPHADNKLMEASAIAAQSEEWKRSEFG